MPHDFANFEFCEFGPVHDQKDSSKLWRAGAKSWKLRRKLRRKQRRNYGVAEGDFDLQVAAH
jgi:hypothetical protein